MKPRLSGSCCEVCLLITEFKEKLELHFEWLYYYTCYKLITKKDRTLMYMINSNEYHFSFLDYVQKRQLIFYGSRTI